MVLWRRALERFHLASLSHETKFRLVLISWRRSSLTTENAATAEVLFLWLVGVLSVGAVFIEGGARLVHGLTGSNHGGALLLRTKPAISTLHRFSVLNGVIAVCCVWLANGGSNVVIGRGGHCFSQSATLTEVGRLYWKIISSVSIFHNSYDLWNSAEWITRV